MSKKRKRRISRNKSKEVKNDNTIRTIDNIVNSEQIKNYLEAAKEYKPLSIKLLGDNLLSQILGGGNYIDSLTVQAQIPAVQTLLNDFPNKDIQILYVASSYGLGMEMIMESGYQNMQGIDIDKKAIEFCTEQNLNTNYMDATDMDFGNGTFDIVISRDLIDSIGYLEEFDRLGVLREMERVLKEEGHAIFTTMARMDIFGYNGLPSNNDIGLSAFAKSDKTEKIVKVTVSDGVRELPVRLYRK